MPTEPTSINQDPFGEVREQWICWILEQFEKHPVLASVVSLLLLFLVGKWVVPMILAFLRRLGITEVFGVAFSEKKPNDNKRIESRISTCPTPRLTEEQRQIRMPKKVLEQAENMENARSDERFRYCVVCSNKELLQCYAVQFYERVEQAFVIDHYGWVYYETPEDKSLNIQNCLHDALKICVNEKLPQDRFRAFVDFFDNPNKHSLLVIQMCEHAQDRKLAQIANLKGLSLILFSECSVDGYDTIEISVKGGRSA